MAEDVYSMLSFGKQIKCDLDSVIKDNQPDHLNKLKNNLILLLNNFESLFVDQFKIQVNFNISESNHVKFHKSNRRLEKEPVSWNYDNPQFNEQQETELMNIIERLVQSNVLTKIPETNQFINPIDLIFKDNKFELNPNFIGINDPKIFNVFTPPVNYVKKNLFSLPYPKTNETISLFSKLVIKDAAYQLILHEDHRKYSSFKIRDSKNNEVKYYQFNTLHPNIKCVNEFLIKKHAKKFDFLSDDSTIKLFGDQILIYSKNYNIHLDHLKLTLNVFKKFNFKISLKDSMVFVFKLQFFDYWLDNLGISIPQTIKQKIKDIQSDTYENRKWLRDACAIHGMYYFFLKQGDRLELKQRYIRENFFYDEKKRFGQSWNELKQELYAAPTIRPPYNPTNPIPSTSGLSYSVESSKINQNLRQNPRQNSPQNPQVSQQNPLPILQQNLELVSQIHRQPNLQQDSPQISQPRLPRFLEIFGHQRPKISQQYTPQFSQESTHYNPQQISQQYLPQFSQESAHYDPQQISQQYLPQFSQESAHYDPQQISQQYLPQFSQESTHYDTQQNLPSNSSQNSLQNPQKRQRKD